MSIDFIGFDPLSNIKLSHEYIHSGMIDFTKMPIFLQITDSLTSKDANL